VTFTKDGFQSLLEYSVIAGGNYEIALANAEAAEALSGAYNYLIEAGKLQHQFAQVRDEQLQRERRDHFIDNWFHRGLIALGILVTL
jgi:hypothetical protein